MAETVEQYAQRGLLETILAGMQQGDVLMAAANDPKDDKAKTSTHADPGQPQPTTPQSQGTKISTGAPMEDHVQSMKASSTLPRKRNVKPEKQIRFQILHTAVGGHAQGAEVTQEQLGVDDAGLERLIDLEAVAVVLRDPTEDEDAEADEDFEEE